MDVNTGDQDGGVVQHCTTCGVWKYLTVLNELVHAIIGELERDWPSLDIKTGEEHMAAVVSFILVVYCLTLLGDEIMKIVGSDLADHIEEKLTQRTPRVLFPLLGRFKDEKFGFFHSIP